MQVVGHPTDISYCPLNPYETGEFELNDQSQVIVESGVKRFTQGFVLPAEIRPLSLRIASLQLGTPADPAILYPEVRLLNANFRILRALPPESFVYRTSIERAELAAMFF